MPWLPFLEMRLGDITKTTLLDGSQAAYGVVNLLQAIGAFIVIIVFLGIALAISPPMTAFTLAFGIIAVAAYRAASLRGSAHTAELSRVADDLSREATEVFGAFKYVRGSGLAEEAWTRMAGLIESFRLRSVRSTTPQTVVRLLYEAGGILFVAGFLAFSLLATSAEIGTSLVFLAVFYRLTPRITVMNDSLYMARVLLPWYESWRAVFRRARANADVPRGDLRPERFDAITGRDLSFGYPTRGTVLSDVSVELRKGTCTAIVGESGSGKTTLMDLLTGLVEPDAGSVSVDGVALQEIDLDWWRRQLGLVMQDSALFSGSVADNVAIGDAEPDRERVLRCLDMAAAKDFVLAMPDGIDTHVGERGSKLSGGQRQRLALARALYRDPGLLCLDEATAALDGESEALILDAVSRVKRDRAVLLVSHRVRTLTVADHIVFLDDGVVVESGSWEELMSAPTRFRRLVDSQS
jgi:ABC-type multidrug transport system fused ATPase/permease subunit